MIISIKKAPDSELFLVTFIVLKIKRKSFSPTQTIQYYSFYCRVWIHLQAMDLR